MLLTLIAKKFLEWISDFHYVDSVCMKFEVDWLEPLRFLWEKKYFNVQELHLFDIFYLQIFRQIFIVGRIYFF